MYYPYGNYTILALFKNVLEQGVIKPISIYRFTKDGIYKSNRGTGTGTGTGAGSGGSGSGG